MRESSLAARALVWAAGTVLIVACSSKTSDSADGGARDASPASEASPTYLPDLDAITCEPTLESLRENVFPVACGFDSCHGSNNAVWGLDLISDGLADELIGKAAATCRDWDRVVPGSPERSFLVQKLVRDVPPCGVRMPFGLSKLPDRVIACITGWIESLPADATLRDR